MLTVRSHTLVGLLAWWWTTDLHPSSSTTCKITLLHATQKGTKTIPRSFPLLWARRKRYLAIDGKWILIPSNNKKESATNGKAAASRRALCVYLVLDTSCSHAIRDMREAWDRRSRRQSCFVRCVLGLSCCPASSWFARSSLFVFHSFLCLSAGSLSPDAIAMAWYMSIIHRPRVGLLGTLCIS